MRVLIMDDGDKVHAIYIGALLRRYLEREFNIGVTAGELTTEFAFDLTDAAADEIREFLLD